MVDKAKYSAPALDKGLDILELLTNARDGMSQNHIAVALDRTVSEIFRMLVTLERRGYVVVDQPGDLYRISPKLFELSHRHPPTRFLIECAYPVLREIAETLRQSCHLVQYHDGDMVVMAMADSPGTSSYSLNIGARVPVLRTSSGYVVLAFQADAAERNRMIEHAAGTSPDDFDAILARIRTQGFEEADSLEVMGVRNLSFPIFGPAATAIAAITVPFLARIGPDAVSIEAARELLAAKHLEISRRVSAVV